MAYSTSTTTPSTEIVLEIIKFLSASKLKMCRLVNTWLLVMIDRNADILPLDMRTFTSTISVLESLEKFFDAKSSRMHLFLKAIRHSASFTASGRRMRVLPSSTCEDLEIDELCSFYGDYQEKLVMQSSRVWQKLINNWFSSTDQKEIRKGGLPSLVEYCSLFNVKIGQKDKEDIKLNLFVNVHQNNGSVCVEFNKSLLTKMLTRKDIRNSEFCCKFCGSTKHEGVNCILHPNLERKLNFRSLPDDFYGFIDESACAGTLKNIGFGKEK